MEQTGLQLKIEDQGKGFVHALHLLDGPVTDRLGEAVEVHRGQLVAQDKVGRSAMATSSRKLVSLATAKP